VVKVDAQNLPSSTFGSSTDLKVGDDVVAIGNALALEGGLSVTRGIVSAKGRSITTDTGTTLNDLIQTDAAINQGNSGGPLVNSNGDVIGINVAGVDPSVAQNIGFAISIDSAKPIIEELKAGKDRRPGYLGVRTQTLTPSIASQLGISTKKGAVVVNTTVDSPAEKAGIKRYDVITEINGKPITTAEEATATIGKLRPGDKAAITYERDGQVKTVDVTLAVRPS
jgi:serine protease Do